MSSGDFDRARRKETWNRVMSFVTGKPSLLLPFDLVRRQIDITAIADAGIQDIEISKVIGSVNRYADFDREFLPRNWEARERWSRVRQVFESEAGFPPIEVYKVGEAYFVVDGNHRVSVARQLGVKRIEAHVTEFTPNVPIDETTDVETLIVKAEQSAFLKATSLDKTRPGQRIQFTRPGRYATLLEHISKHRYFVGLRTQREVSFEEAATSWYDSLYRPLVSILDEAGLLKEFPGRTEADLYVWVTNHLHALREHFGEGIGLEDAARDFAVRRRRHKRLDPRGRPIEAGDTGKALTQLAERLRVMARRGAGPETYRVPNVWLDERDLSGGATEMAAVRFWDESVHRVLASPPADRIEGIAGAWTRRAVVYNLFVRVSAAFDHDGDGRLEVLNADGIRETGTFVKAIGLLPYIRSLGCNTVHLLPVCRIGRDGRKGTLGSPYAIQDPYAIDETLSEPMIGLGPDLEFRGFVEAAHRLGLRVVLEFTLRTAAKDSAWVPQHPDWFYWIRDRVVDRRPGADGYGSPRFSASDLETIKRRVAAGDCKDTIPPPPQYRSLFTEPPPVQAIRLADGRFVGRLRSGTDVRIPGAFADWPPDDVQPPWNDVTYLRLYRHPDFNYIAYNTVRAYDRRLAVPIYEVTDLWDCIAGILPHFQNRFAIDGAMIDMGHALPIDLKRRIIAGSRSVNPSFALWDEDFLPSERTKREGYNAVVGNYWWAVHRPDELRGVVEGWSREEPPLPSFAAAETHNTPRSAGRDGGERRSLFAWTFGAFLPAIPFLHSGQELAEATPVNTGLDFSAREASRFPESELPLYNPHSYAWTSDGRLREAFRRVLAVRQIFESSVVDSSPTSIRTLPTTPASAIAYLRLGRERILIVGNPGGDPADVEVACPSFIDGEVVDLIVGRRALVRDGRLAARLAPWDCLVFVPPASRHPHE